MKYPKPKFELVLFIFLQSIKNIEGSSPTSEVFNIFGELERIFGNAVRCAYPEASKLPVQIQVSKMADYQCNASMGIAKVLFQ